MKIEELKGVLARAVYINQLERDRRESGRFASFEGIVGSSPQIRAVSAMIRKISAADVSVLIVSESGTGKELAARGIHQRSSRKDGPFIAINCRAIPENLLESELFGHEKGSFTGAHGQRRGHIEMAHGGTFFLDEIGELSAKPQVKLLRFLEVHEVQRIGGRCLIAVDARVLAATNIDLKRQCLRDGSARTFTIAWQSS